MTVMDRIELGVLVTRRPVEGEWGGEIWKPQAVLIDPPPLPPFTRLRSADGIELFYAGITELRLYPGETSHYRDNFTAERPSIWVSFRPDLDGFGEIVGVTADPYEGEAYADSIGDAVEPVEMPLAIKEWIEAFFAANHVERTFFKRRRDRADPNASGKRPPTTGGRGSRS
jgi:hypothetical protein